MSIRIAFMPLIFALTALPVYAQGRGGPPAGGSLAAQVAALQARVAKLEGQIVAADLAGTYKLVGVVTDLDGGFPARVESIALSGTITLAADGTGTFDSTGNGIGLVQGTPWAEVPLLDEDAGSITWTYADGTLTIPDFGVSFVVGVGGRVLSFAGLSDDNTVDLLILTRLQ